MQSYIILTLFEDASIIIKVNDSKFDNLTFSLDNKLKWSPTPIIFYLYVIKII